jgi:hypothetical protein
MDYEQALEVFELEDLETTTFNNFRKLYKKLAKQRHPDTKDGSDKEFVELREAYVLLSEYGDFADFEEENPNAIKLSKTTKNTLKSLTKDEIIKKYYKDTQNLENEIDVYKGFVENQEHIITRIKHRVSKITKDFDHEKDLLKKDLKLELKRLDIKYRSNNWRKVLFFLPSNSEKEYWENYNKQLDEYSAKYSELNTSFFKLILTCYGNGLNKISKQMQQPQKEKM